MFSTSCAPEPLYATVVELFVAALKVPLFVIVPAIPSEDEVARVRVPLIVILLKFDVPVKVEFPPKITAPLEVNVPLLVQFPLTVYVFPPSFKEPVIETFVNDKVPAPEHADVPANVTVLLASTKFWFVVRLPDKEIFPVAVF